MYELPAQNLQGKISVIYQEMQPRFITTAIKIVSYITIILPVVVLLMKMYLRSTKKYHIVNPHLHIHLNSLLQPLGYPQLPGLCYGVSCMGLRAIALGQEKKFNERIDKLSQILDAHNNDADKTVKTLQQSHKSWFTEECLPFFDGTWLFQNHPIRISELLPQDCLPPILQQIYPPVYAMLNPPSQEKNSITYLTAATGQYTPTQLTQLLADLGNTAGSQPVHLFLIGYGPENPHSILLSYVPTTKSWLYLDVNTLPILSVKDTTSLVTLIFSSFPPKSFDEKTIPSIPLSIQTLSSEQKSSDSKKKLQELFSKKWAPALRITNEKREEYANELLNIACLGADTAMASFLLENPESWIHKKILPSPLTIALFNKLEDIALKLIEKGVDIHAKDPGGDTPLHCAIHAQLASVAQKLLEKGADIHAKNHLGDTPLHLALNAKLDSIALTLIEKGADIHAKDGEGVTPLEFAIRMDLETVALKLLEKGADIFTTNHLGASALHYAIANQCTRVLKKLLTNKVPLFYEDSKTISPIEIALIQNDQHIKQLVLQEFLKRRITTIDLSSLQHLPKEILESIKPKEGLLWKIKPYLQKLNEDLNLSRGTRKNPPRACKPPKGR